MSWRRLLAILVKELRQVRRDRLTFGMMVGVPIIQLVLFGFAINADPRGLPLAVISNWDSHLPRLLEALRLAPFFRVVSVSAIEATGKPSPEIFLRTCLRLGVSPAEALHIGDSPRDDVEGAEAAGLSALLLDRDDRHADAPRRIRSLGEVTGWISAR